MQFPLESMVQVGGLTALLEQIVQVGGLIAPLEQGAITQIEPFQVLPDAQLENIFLKSSKTALL